MTRKHDAAAIAALPILDAAIAAAGVVALARQVRRDDLPGFYTAEVHVAATSPASKAAQALCRALGAALRQRLRSGVYTAADGYDDVPAGQALIQIDLIELRAVELPMPARGAVRS